MAAQPKDERTTQRQICFKRGGVGEKEIFSAGDENEMCAILHSFILSCPAQNQIEITRQPRCHNSRLRLRCSILATLLVLNCRLFTQGVTIAVILWMCNRELDILKSDTINLLPVCVRLLGIPICIPSCAATMRAAANPHCGYMNSCGQAVERSA